MVWLVPAWLPETLRPVLDFKRLNVTIRTHVVFDIDGGFVLNPYRLFVFFEFLY